ncbi:MAG: hypothetical protein MZU79_00650 [Anaerotruncus sp.]|nr:hypothetical protein [Anaerotruncus sp.]
MPDGVGRAAAAGGGAARAADGGPRYNVGAFNPSAEESPRRSVLKAFPGAQITYEVRRAAPGDPRLVAGRRRRLRRAEGLGLRAEVRLRARVLRVPDPDDPGAVSEVGLRLSGPRTSLRALSEDASRRVEGQGSRLSCRTIRPSHSSARSSRAPLVTSR